MIVRPPKVQPQKGRSHTSHHGPPSNPLRTGRAPTAWNRYVQAEERRLLQEAAEVGKPITSQQAMQLCSQSWPTVRDAMDVDTGARAGTRRKHRPPAVCAQRSRGTGGQRAETPPPPVRAKGAPNSRDAHVRSRKSADAAPSVVCTRKGCPLVWRRLPPPEMCFSEPLCDECSKPLGKFSWTCATVPANPLTSCDYDMCGDCYTSRS